MRCLRGPEEMCNLMAARRQILWQGTDDLRAWLRSAGYVAFIPLTVTLGNLPAWQVKIGEWVEISGTQAGGARSCKFLWQGLRLSGWIILSHHCALVSLFFFSFCIEKDDDGSRLGCCCKCARRGSRERCSVKWLLFSTWVTSQRGFTRMYNLSEWEFENVVELINMR